MSIIKLKRAWYVENKAIYIFSRTQYLGKENEYDNYPQLEGIDIECDTNLLADVLTHHPECKEVHLGYGCCEPMNTPKQVFQLARDIRKKYPEIPIYIHCNYTWERLNKYNNTFTYLVQIAELGGPSYIQCADSFHDLEEYFIAVQEE